VQQAQGNAGRNRGGHRAGHARVADALATPCFRHQIGGDGVEGGGHRAKGKAVQHTHRKQHNQPARQPVGRGEKAEEQKGAQVHRTPPKAVQRDAGDGPHHHRREGQQRRQQADLGAAAAEVTRDVDRQRGQLQVKAAPQQQGRGHQQDKVARPKRFKSDSGAGFVV